MKRRDRATVQLHHRQTRPQRAKTSEGSVASGRRRFVIWLVACTVFVMWAGIQLYQQTGKIADKQHELEQAELKLQQATETKQELQARIERLRNPEYVDELARKEYYMSREGEIIFVDP